MRIVRGHICSRNQQYVLVIFDCGCAAYSSSQGCPQGCPVPVEHPVWRSPNRLYPHHGSQNQQLWQSSTLNTEAHSNLRDCSHDLFQVPKHALIASVHLLFRALVLRSCQYLSILKDAWAVGLRHHDHDLCVQTQTKGDREYGKRSCGPGCTSGWY